MTETVLMASFGENLRRERELRGVTLEEISAATKISVRFLKSIENEDFSKLPGGLFNRSFVRAYARYLGLEEDPLLTEYQLAAKAKGEVDVARLSFPVSHSLRPRTSRSAWAGVIAAIVLLGAGYGLWRYSRGSSGSTPETKTLPIEQPSPSRPATTNPAAPAPPAGSPAPSPAPQANAPGAGTQTKNEPASQPPAAADAPAPPAANAKEPTSSDYANNLVLQVATTESSWIAVDADGKTIMQGIMNPNEVKTFKAKDFFDVLTGNARGVVLTLNGQTLKPLGREGEVKSVHLAWNDLKNQKSP